jgi:hypothetical protein
MASHYRSLERASIYRMDEPVYDGDGNFVGRGFGLTPEQCEAREKKASEAAIKKRLAKHLAKEARKRSSAT